MLRLVHLLFEMVEPCLWFIVVLGLAQNTASVDMRDPNRRVKRIQIGTLAILNSSTAIWSNHALVVPFEAGLLKMLLVQNVGFDIGISAPHITVSSYTNDFVANLRFVILYSLAQLAFVEILRL